MNFLKSLNKKILVSAMCFLSISSFIKAEEKQTLEVLKTLQKDLKTLEKAVYSQSSNVNTTSTKTLSTNDEDVLTRHLLKLSEIEKYKKWLAKTLRVELVEGINDPGILKAVFLAGGPGSGR